MQKSSLNFVSLKQVFKSDFIPANVFLASVSTNVVSFDSKVPLLLSILLEVVPINTKGNETYFG